MRLSTPLSILLLSGSMSFASTLSVYQDKTFYSYVPSQNFIGFGRGITAKCDGNTVALEQLLSCPEDERLCQLYSSVKMTGKKIRRIQANKEVLAKLISLPKPTTFDAEASINAARVIGEEQARLREDESDLLKHLKRKEHIFSKQAPQKEATGIKEVCTKSLEVMIPYGYVSFSTGYTANLVNDNEITVTQSLSIVNRSGIDMELDTAMFYYRSANQYVNATHFYPWIVRKYVPRPVRTLKKSKRMMSKEMAMGAAPMLSMVADEVEVMDIPPAPVASYEDAREYKITHLKLPSTGDVLDVNVVTWKSKMDCELKAYPYANPKAFNVCSFTPKYQIDANKWKILKGSEVINEKAKGEYRGDKYQLYTKNDDDIKILRVPRVKRERETGIFGGTVRKKDGFNLVLINKSNKTKILTVVERIPTSTTDEIKVKLLSVKSKNKVDYKMLDNGKIEMKVTLDVNSKKEIDVLFEISYDKDLKVKY